MTLRSIQRALPIARPPTEDSSVAHTGWRSPIPQDLDRTCMLQFRMLRICKLSSESTTPVRATKESAGYDLFSPISTTIASHGKQLIALDIAIQVPAGTYGRIAPRSGLAHRSFIDVGAGVIDRDYRGNVSVLLFNFGATPYQIRKGDRIAQLILERICTPPVHEVYALCDSERGDGAFMSTGR